MAVMTARGVAKRLTSVQKLKVLYMDAVAALREDAIKTTVGTLWRRYNEHKRRALRSGEESFPEFLDWLTQLKHLERTFWHKSTGAGLATRRKWAFGYYNFLTRKELTLADDPDNLWIFAALEAAINAKLGDSDWVVHVEAVTRKAIPKERLKEGTTFMFGRVELPEEPEEEEE